MRLPALLSLFLGPLVFASRRTGLQGKPIYCSIGFSNAGTLYLVGGLYLDENGKSAPGNHSIDRIDLHNDFTVGQKVGSLIIAYGSKPDYVPDVSYGVAWGDYRNRTYIHGGTDINGGALENDIWEVDMSDSGQSWTKLVVDLSGGRPSHGASCDFARLQKGFHLGGWTAMSNTTNLSIRSYRHTLDIWDIDKKTMTYRDVPDFVPIVDQSLVPLNTQHGKELLVALGGFTVQNRTLSMKPMTSISVYDIKNDEWYEQNATGIHGSVEQDNTSQIVNSTGVPQPRVRACAAGGSPLDRSSHNIVVLGGQNDTNTVSDVWILSMPSFIWIKALLPDLTNAPKADASCLLINSQYVFQFGGCFNETGSDKSCAGYSFDPLVYNIVDASWSDYVYHRTWYFVPQRVYEIIGGKDVGGANFSSPAFTSFSNARLTELFLPPEHSDRDALDYTQRLKVVALICLLAVFPSTLWVMFGSICFRKARNLHQQHRKPWAVSLPYLIFVISSSSVLLALLITLRQESQKPDTDTGHWHGVAVPGSFREDDARKPQYSNQPGPDVPPQGLFSVYFDQGSSAEWSERNFTDHLSRLMYWTWTYLPLLTVVLYGRAWKILDMSLKSVYKYAHLTKQGGASTRSSVLLTYHTFWAPLYLIQALRYRHWIIALSSTGYIIATIIIPVVQNYVFYWHLFAVGTLTWDPWTLFWTSAIVDPYWSRILISLLAINILIAIILTITIQIRDSCLRGNPEGLIGVAERVRDTNFTLLKFPADADKQTLSQLEDSLAMNHYELLGSGDSQLLQLVRAPDKNRTSHPTLQRLSRIFVSIASYVPQPVKKQSKSLRSWCFDHPHFFIFRKPTSAFWLVFLLSLAAYGSVLVTALNRNSAEGYLNYAITIPPQLFIICGVFIQSVMDVVEDSVRILAPIDLLRRGYQPPHVLFQDYTSSGIPLIEIAQAWRDGQYLLGSTMLAGYAAAVYTIFFGSLQLSSTFFGATSFYTDQTAAVASTILITFILGVNCCIGWRYSRATWLTKPPDSMAASVTHFLFSDMLREDLIAIKGLSTRAEKIEKLVGFERRYAFGVFGNDSRIGIERHEHLPDSANGRVRGSTVRL